MATGQDIGAETLKDLKVIQKQAPNVFAAALFQEAQIERREVIEVTPREFGALRASIIVRGPFRKALRIWVIMQAGGPTATYAEAVHFDLEAFHDVGGALFIQDPLKEAIPFLPKRVAARINASRTFAVGKVARGGGRAGFEIDPVDDGQ